MSHSGFEQKTEILNDLSSIRPNNEESKLFNEVDLAKFYPKMEEENFKYLTPRDYQEAIVEHICDHKDNYGRIISLETGLGKTFIAVLFIFKTLGLNHEKVMKGQKKKRRNLALTKASSRFK